MQPSSYEDAANEFGRRSHNEVAAEVLERYLPFWIQSETAKQAVIAGQRQRAGLEVSQPYTKGRGSKGEAARVKQDAERREKEKRKR